MLSHLRIRAVLPVVATGTLFIALGGAGQTPSGTQVPEAKGPSKPPTASLYEAETVQFSAPPPAVTATGTLCDERGNMYLQYLASVQLLMSQLRDGGISNLPLTRVSLESNKTTEFRVPAPEGYPHYYDRGFYVTPRGNVYVLIEAYRYGQDYKEDPNWPDSFVVKYKDDGSVDSVTKLGLPQDVHFSPSKLGVFGDGTLLVTGTEVSGPRHTPSKVFTAVFDRAGTYVGPVTLTDDVHPAPPQPGAIGAEGTASPAETGNERAAQGAGGGPDLAWAMDVRQGRMLGSPDGNIYLFRDTSPARVCVVSPGGVVTRQFRITPPERGMKPIKVSFGGQGEMLVEFSTLATPDSRQSHTVVGLVDPESGDVVQVVAPPPNAGVLGCLSPKNEFLFLRTSKDEHLEVAGFVSR